MGRGHSCNAFKNPIKVRDIRKSCFPADLGDTLVSLHELPLSIHDPGHVQVLDNSGVRMLFKFPAEIIGAEIKSPGKLFQTDLFIKIRVDKMEHFSDPVQFFYPFRLFQLPGNLQEKSV